MPHNNRGDKFCYVSGEAIFSSSKRNTYNFTNYINESSTVYFGCKIGNQDNFDSKCHLPHVCNIPKYVIE